MELMNHNISQNMSLFPVCPPEALPLDWDEDLPTEVVEIGGFDLIVFVRFLLYLDHLRLTSFICSSQHG